MSDWLEKFLATPKPAPAEVYLPGPVTPNGSSTVYGKAALAGEIAKVLAAAKGERNDTLNRSAFKLGQLVNSGHVTEADAVAELRAAAATIGLSATEIAATVRSGMSSGQGFPRTPEELSTSTVTEVGLDEFGATTEGPPEEAQTDIDRRYLQLSEGMRDVEGIRGIKPGIAIVNNFLFTNSLAWLSGKPGHGKSFVAIELSCCVATGTPWHSHEVKRGRVVYVIAEGLHGFAPRVDAWIMEHNAYLDDIRFLIVPVNMMQPLDVAALARVLDDFKPSLIVFDTQARVTVGAEENSSRDMGQFVDALERLKVHSGACVLVIHHEPRGGENLRGSSALEGAATSILRAGKEGDQVTVTTTKQKDTIAAEPLVLTLESRGASAVLVRAGMEARALSESARKLLEVLDDFGDKWVSKTTFHDAAGFLAKTTFYRAVNELVRRGLILEREDAKNRYSYRIPEVIEP